ncbi:MAG: hypothetical protein A3E94_00465 [Candidatus Zambryskibacteria bacterium RIFCSPHIGHO2_12_FULL_44_12b]|uniref:TraC-like domain-containing protein n=1 Tax=Candidatus Zambryskibacteria bacterium RIFCSPLOWO2_01_FULL_45_21 TaxID=1802761 RepID=A0A1G2U4D2_9BACT|nr:MAG: hypothetical protein A3E94_00465 [Candidatus Zambryskibacteria bacterium RIFCSPHIGHO2_12_FULL_44_12b]OHB04354.1 MAG: hypothetical protein A3B14_02720 [Candidatus Zambryskibacteria bacterium RIFCSPLOWO2_01_FULL_45_21]
MAIPAKPTQDFVPIEEIRDGIILLKDGGMRAIILASSLNFSLKSEDEKTAIIMQFQDFLNSLDFSIQIFVQSRKLDIRPYLALLENQKKNQVNDLMKIQIQEYMDFVKKFTESTNIMTKSFFVVVPYSPGVLQTKENPIKRFMPAKQSAPTNKEENFEENRSQLEQRLAVVEQGLMRCGVRTARLGTEEIIELFYKTFNPGETEKPIQLQEQ